MKKNLTYRRLVEIASQGYPKKLPERSVTKDGGLAKADLSGDGLAHFIAVELHSTFDSKAAAKDQLREAHRAIQQAAEELDGVVMVLEDALTIETRKTK